KNRTIYIDIRDVSTLDFDLSEAQKRSLVDAAKVGVQDYWRRVQQAQQPIRLPKALLASLAEHSEPAELHVNSDGRLHIPWLRLESQAPALVYEFHRHGESELTAFQRLGISLHSRDLAGHTALHLAIARRDFTAVTRLLASGCNPNLPRDNGEYPLDL